MGRPRAIIPKIQKIEGEKWKRIHGTVRKYKYKVSNFGRVKGRNFRVLGYPICLLKQVNWGKPKDGYRGVILNFRDKGSKTRSIHSLVLEAFIGKRPGLNFESNHKDLNPGNNYYKNLEWVTHKRNIEHWVENGAPRNTSRGEDRPSSVLTENQVRKIRRKFTGKYGQIAKLARKFKVTPRTIREVVLYSTWRHVK